MKFGIIKEPLHENALMALFIMAETDLKNNSRLHNVANQY